LIVGDPERYPVRAIIFLAAVSGMVAFIGLYFAVVENLDPSATSGPLIRTVVSWLTNFFAWAVLSVGGLVFFINRWWARAASRAAAETRYSKDAIKRLRQELTSTDGSVRLIGTPNHSRDELRAKLMRAFAGQYDGDRPGRDVDVSPPEAENTGKALAHDSPEAALPDKSGGTGGDESDSGIDKPSIDSTDDRGADVDDLHDEQDLAAALERGSNDAALLGLSASLRGYRPEPSMVEELTLVQDAVDRDPNLVLEDGEVRLGNDPDDTEDDLSHLLDDSEGELPDDIDADDHDGQPDESEQSERSDPSAPERGAASFRQAIQTFRMDLATTLNFQEVLTRFVLPGAVAVLAVLTVAGTPWFAPWVYPVIFAFGTLVGTINYGVFKWRRRRKLRKLRTDPETGRWSSCAVLAKRVETPEQTMYAAWMGGLRYADFDKQRLVEKVADRWYQRLHGEEVAPAIQEKFGREIAHCRPLLKQFEYRNPDEGRKGIEDDIIDVIREAKDPDGMVSKRSLAETVVGRGPDNGHDPDLVAEVYESLVPRVLSETEVSLVDTDGIDRTVTAVHLRWMDVPDDLSQIRAQFSNQFSADKDPTHELPEVSPAGIGEPAYASHLPDLPTEGPRTATRPNTAD
jgi:hypothetical protein